MSTDTVDGLLAGLGLGFVLTVGGVYVLARIIDNERRRPSKQKRVEL